MKIIDELLEVMDEGKVIDVCIGLHWTAVVVEVNGKTRCGLSSTIAAPHGHDEGADVPLAGKLTSLSSIDLAGYANSVKPTLMSVGIAAINALMPPTPENWVDINAEDIILNYGQDKKVAVIGSFPFIPRIRNKVGELFVIEKNPHADEYSSEHAQDILADMDVVAITGMTLVNHTYEYLISLCNPKAVKLVLGPSTPLSPIFFNHDIHLLSGSFVTDIENVVRFVGQGANFHQVHQAGVRLVTIKSPRFS